MSEQGSENKDRRIGALIVSDDPWKVDRWAGWLEQAGFFTTSCPGPHLAWQCPRLDGERCALRELMDVAVVEVPAAATELYGGWAERSCTKVPDDGATVYVGSGVGAESGQNGIQLNAPVEPGALVEASLEAWWRNRQPILRGGQRG